MPDVEQMFVAASFPTAPNKDFFSSSLPFFLWRFRSHALCQQRAAIIGAEAVHKIGEILDNVEREFAANVVSWQILLKNLKSCIVLLLGCVPDQAQHPVRRAPEKRHCNGSLLSWKSILHGRCRTAPEGTRGRQLLALLGSRLLVCSRKEQRTLLEGGSVRV